MGSAILAAFAHKRVTTPVQAQTEIADQIDPNLARYRRVLEENGVSATPYILAVGYQPAPPAAAPRETVTAEDAMPDEGRISSDPTGSEDGHYARAELAALAATPPLQTDMPRYRPPAAVDDALFDTAASVTLPAQ